MALFARPAQLYSGGGRPGSKDRRQELSAIRQWRHGHSGETRKLGNVDPGHGAGHDYFLLAARHNKRSYRPPAPRPTDRPRHVSAPSNPPGLRRVRPRRRGPARANGLHMHVLGCAGQAPELRGGETWRGDERPNGGLGARAGSNKRYGAEDCLPALSEARGWGRLMEMLVDPSDQQQPYPHNKARPP